jgi:tetratricopeptide (TPR) repeat protein
VHADAVSALVALLDHLPLAIELAAARARLFPVPELLARMHDRFRLLAVPRGSDRRQTLRATLDWSWELLTADERSVLAQLSVFPGSFSLRAAEDVVAAGDGWVPDLVQALIDRSLVQATANGRLELLHSVRAYAAERAEDPAVTERFGRHYAALGSEGSLASVDRPGGADVREAFAREQHNLVAACRWAAGAGHGAIAVATLRAAWSVLELAGPWATGAELAAAVLAIPDLEPGPAADAGIVGLVAATLLGRADQAVAIGRRALERAREAGDPGREARVLGRLAPVLARLGATGEAQDATERALALARSLGDRGWEAYVLGGMANRAALAGRPDEAQALHEQALALHRAVGDRRMEGIVLGNLGLLLQDRGRTEEARRLLDAALACHRAFGERRAEAVVLGGLASVADAAGRLDEARELLEAALALHRRLGSRPREAAVLGHLATLRLAAGQPDVAARLAVEAGALASEVGDPRLCSAAASVRADVELAAGRADAAVPHLEEAVARLRPVALPADLAQLLLRLGTARAAAGSPGAARVALDEGLALARQHGASAVEDRLRSALAALGA